MAVERSRAEDEPRNRREVGAELQAVIELAEQFAVSTRGEMRYPILKRLLGARE